MHYVRIFNDEAGESHFEDVSLPEVVVAPEQGVAELTLSDSVPVDRAIFVSLPGDEQAPDWHTAPRRQFVVVLDGGVRIEVSDGEVRDLPAGSVVLVEDTTGRGHVTEYVPGPRRVILIPLEADE